MEANEFVGFTLPVVNAGPWSYFSNGGVSEDGEDETMIIEGIITEDDFIINETSKNIYDAIASGKTVIIKTESAGAYSFIIETSFSNDTYYFNISQGAIITTVSGAADENPSVNGGSNDNIG